MVYIRKYTCQGSTVTKHVLQEAEEIVESTRSKGGFVFDEETKEKLEGSLQEEGHYAVVWPIAGG